MTVEQVKSFARSCGLKLVEVAPTAFDSYHRPIGGASFRLVDSRTAQIITYGDLKTINGYLTMRMRF
jgi:hypothetical protein